MDCEKKSSVKKIALEFSVEKPAVESKPQSATKSNQKSLKQTKISRAAK